jgi:hypothetical protein
MVSLKMQSSRLVCQFPNLNKKFKRVGGMNEPASGILALLLICLNMSIHSSK